VLSSITVGRKYNMIMVPVSIGELYDKISILEIKKDYGLSVDKELDELNKIASKLNDSHVVNYLRDQLHLVNQQIWVNENDKRAAEKEKKFDDRFIEFGRAVYILNDQRAAIKRLINDITNSEIKEYKSHASK